MDWAWLPAKGTTPKRGLIAACGEHLQGEKWWFVHTDGLYFSPDGGITLSKVMDESGKR